MILKHLTTIVGEKHVLTGEKTEKYARDWLGKYIAKPTAVVRPANTAEVSKVVKYANRNGIVIVPISGNTGLVGGTYAPDVVMLSLERLNQIREIRASARIAVVGAGTILTNIHDAAAKHDLTFPLYFGARGSAMIGGNLSTNAGGSNVLRYGNTRALCLGLEVVLPDGEILNAMSELHKDNSGYDLKDLFIGAEGTLGIITAAVLKLSPQPQTYATAMVSAVSLCASLELLNRLQQATGGLVEAFEYMPRTYMERLKSEMPELRPPMGYDHDTTILLEVASTANRDSTLNDDGSSPLTKLVEETLAELIEEGLATDAVIANSDTQRATMWKIRESAAEITLNRLPMVDTDIAVPVDKVPEFMELALERLHKMDELADTITVSHLGDGNVHFTIWPSKDDPDFHDDIREMVEDVTLQLRGSFSAEHGIGLTKLNSMTRRKDAVAIDTMKKIKAALDPNNIMNPGKVLPE